MCVARIRSRKGTIIVSPREGAKDGPTQPYPTPRLNGRGPERPLLSHRRCLRAAQPEREALRASQAALGLGDHHPRPLATASRRGVGALLLARHPEVFLSSVPRVVGLHPSSLHRRVRKLRRLEWSLCSGRSFPSW